MSISCVLYELQPFRIVDVIGLSKYLYKSVWDLGLAGVTLSDLVYQSAFYESVHDSKNVGTDHSVAHRFRCYELS